MLALAELLALVDGRLVSARVTSLLNETEASGGADSSDATVVRAVAELERAGAGDLAFCVGGRSLPAKALESCAASVILVPRGAAAKLSTTTGSAVLIEVRDPRHAATLVLQHLHPRRPAALGIHATAVLGDDVKIADGVTIGPYAVLGDGAQVGVNSEIGAGCVLEADVVIGNDCLVHPNATIYRGCRLGDRVDVHAGVVIGSDGFGYVREGATHIKMPQIGTVVIGDDVEVGANSCVDRATLSETRIGSRTKIDNLVQVGHNCDIGEDCALGGLVGLSGGTIFEDGVIAGGNVGTAGHQRIGRGAMLAAKTGVLGDVSPGAVVCGTPQMEIGLFKRVAGAWRRLPDLLRRVRRLEQKVDAELARRDTSGRAVE